MTKSAHWPAERSHRLSTAILCSRLARARYASPVVATATGGTYWKLSSTLASGSATAYDDRDMLCVPKLICAAGL